MKSFLSLSFFLSVSVALAQTQDPLGDHIKTLERKEADKNLDNLVNKIEAERKVPTKKVDTQDFVKTMKKSLNDPKLPQETKDMLLDFVKNTNVEAYKAYVEEVTKKENLELSGCQMSSDQKAIDCGDKVYKMDSSGDSISTRANTKSDLEAPRSPADEKAGGRGY